MVRDGFIYGVSLLAVALVVVWATGNWAWGIVPVLLALFFLWFFRDPPRMIPAGTGLIVSPGDGLVTEAAPINTPNGPRQRISIFLSVFDVHVNRSPIGGILSRVEYQKGQYLNAMNPASAERNEQNIVTVRGEGFEVTFKQIAGLLARRIVFNFAQGDAVQRGPRLIFNNHSFHDPERVRARQARFHRGMYLLPSLFTSINIGAGYWSITQTIAAITSDAQMHLDWAAIAILFAIPFDALDGRIARMTNTTSDFGRELDSLADVITFGVAPSLLAFVWGFHFLPDSVPTELRQHVVQAGAFICFLFLLSGASRLARFNISHDAQPRNPGRPGRKYFVGMPIPAAAGLLAASVHLCYGIPNPYWSALPVFLWSVPGGSGRPRRSTCPKATHSRCWCWWRSSCTSYCVIPT
jgi:CDP-diacylglycerol--serine O-phosphatidyltransferase